MVSVDGHRVTLTHPDRVLYPAGEDSPAVTKQQVVDYYRAIAPVLLPHCAERPVTRKRWPDGVGGESFFERRLPRWAPEWLPRMTLQHRDHRSVYPLADSEAALAWFGQQSALELHVPQWRRDHPVDPEAASPRPPSAFRTRRIVFDLDPGPGAGITGCAEVARLLREVVSDGGLECFPVTSGSKGIHVYVLLGKWIASEEASRTAHAVADALAARHPRTVTAAMRKSERSGRVFIDWSQNTGAKTTVAPYSLRGRDRPTVAAPRTWDELDDPDLRQLRYDEVLERVARHGDLLAGLEPTGGGRSGPDRLAEYRRRRDPDRTPEPVPRGTRRGAGADGPGRRFVIQEHHASTLHWDFRLERDGVLVSWAVPKNLPTDPAHDRLAVHTEDHPLEYAGFSGDIPRGEYGAGHVDIWDSGDYDAVTWEDDEIVVDLHGSRACGRYALIRTGSGRRGAERDGRRWLMHRVKDQPGAGPEPGGARFPAGIEPMLATPGDITGFDSARWAFEGKWDGHRTLIEVRDGTLRLRSRGGREITAELPGFAGLAGELAGHEVVLDAELVALTGGVPDFAALQHRTDRTDLRLYVFDVLHLDGRSLLRTPYRDRRRVLEALAPLLRSAEVPDTLGGDARTALRSSRERGLEGVIAKRLDSRYHPGRRTHTWIKQKNMSADEAVICGYTRGNGARAATFGALILGEHDGDGLRYAGKVGTGFAESDLESLARRLHRIRRKTSPLADEVPRADAADPQWVRPSLVAEVRHAGRTEAGRFRHPSWRGLRPDKSPDEVRREKG